MGHSTRSSPGTKWFGPTASLWSLKGRIIFCRDQLALRSIPSIITYEINDNEGCRKRIASLSKPQTVTGPNIFGSDVTTLVWSNTVPVRNLINSRSNREYHAILLFGNANSQPMNLMMNEVYLLRLFRPECQGAGSCTVSLSTQIGHERVYHQPLRF
jgi:hypothetical protein